MKKSFKPIEFDIIDLDDCIVTTSVGIGDVPVVEIDDSEWDESENN